MSAFVWTDERNQKDLCKFLETLLMFHRYGFFFFGGHVRPRTLSPQTEDVPTSQLTMTVY